MEFRWVALIALWTLVSGPILGTPSNPASATRSSDRQIVQPLVKQTLRP